MHTSYISYPWLSRQGVGVEVWWKPWEAIWERRRSWDSLPASFKPYIVHRFVDAEKEVGFAGGVRLDEGGMSSAFYNLDLSSKPVIFGKKTCFVIKKGQ